VYSGAQAEGKLPEPNMRMWNATTGDLMHLSIVKRQSGWAPQWAGELCCRVQGSEILFAVDHVKRAFSM